MLGILEDKDQIFDLFNQYVVDAACWKLATVRGYEFPPVVDKRKLFTFLLALPTMNIPTFTHPCLPRLYNSEFNIKYMTLQCILSVNYLSCVGGSETSGYSR